MNSLLGAYNLLNDPVGLTLIIGGIVLVAVAVILYFFVFKKKINAKVAENKVNKEQKAVKDAKAQGLAGSVFKEEDEHQEKKKMSDAEMEAFNKKVDAIVSSKQQGRVDMSKIDAKIAAEKAKEEKKIEEKEKETGFNIMSQFGNKKD